MRFIDAVFSNCRNYSIPQFLNAAFLDQIVEIGGRRLKLTNLEKVLYPASGFTKGQVIDYYARIAPVLVPHLAGTAAHAETLSQRRRSGIFLREERHQASARLGADRAHME